MARWIVSVHQSHPRPYLAGLVNLPLPPNDSSSWLSGTNISVGLNVSFSSIFDSCVITDDCYFLFSAFIVLFKFSTGMRYLIKVLLGSMIHDSIVLCLGFSFSCLEWLGQGKYL